MSAPRTMSGLWRGLTLGLAAAVFLPAPLRPQDGSARRAERIVRKIDALYRSRSSEALVEMEIVTPNWQRTLRMRLWTRGMKDTFIRILEPKKEAGVGTLRIGSEMWNYLPNTDKIIKIPPSMMMSSWMGSDFTNDDLVKEYTFVDDYSFRMITPDRPAGSPLCRVPAQGGPAHRLGDQSSSPSAKRIVPVWQKSYDEKGRVVREMVFGEVKTFGRRRIPATIELVPQTEEGHKTVLRYIDAEVRHPLRPRDFLPPQPPAFR